MRSRGTMEAVHVVPHRESVHVVPHRRRSVDGTYTTDPVDPTKKRKIMLTLREIETRVHMPIEPPARSLGISSTTLKKTCRLLGMPRWPYSRRGTSYSKSSSKPRKNEAPPTCESPLWFSDSMYPLWDSELWDPDAGTPPLCYPDTDTHPLCLDSGPCQDTDEVSDEGCDLWFLACECSPRCGPLCEFTSRPNVDSSLWI